MSVVRVGSTQKFADGWENVFGGGNKSPVKKPSATKKASKKTAKPAAKKKYTVAQATTSKKSSKSKKSAVKSKASPKGKRTVAKKPKAGMQQKVLF